MLYTRTFHNFCMIACILQIMRVLVCLLCVLSVLPYAHCDDGEGIWDGRCISLHSILNGHAFSSKSDDQLLAATASGSGSAIHSSLRFRLGFRLGTYPWVIAAGQQSEWSKVTHLKSGNFLSRDREGE